MRYVDRIGTIPNTDPDNALILGTALHTGIEEGVAQALEFYQNSFPVLTDEHINEMIKLEALIPKAAALLPPGGRFELPIGNADFIGFMDYLAPVFKDTFLGLNYYDLYDFKYSNNSKSYLESGQLHEYKYWFELTHPNCIIRNLYFLFVPKVKIRQKGTETLIQFRDRLTEALADATPWVEQVQYNSLKVVDFLTDAKHILEATDYPKKPNHFCGWCEYEEFCMKGWDYMLLPENKRRTPDATKKKVVWVYGAPFSGKTFFANSFPDPLMLNTDPCPVVVSLKDGSNHTLFKFRDFLDMVDQEMGMDAAKWLEAHVNRLEEAADYTTAKVETDLTGYEASLESNRTAFTDIQEQAATIMEVLQGPRMNRQRITHAVREIGKIIENQI